MRDDTWARNALVITVAPCGAEVSRADNPAVPYMPAEIARETTGAVAAGAAVVHLHVREDDGAPTHRGEVFRDAIERIRAETDVICNVSTGGAIGMTMDERLECLTAAPDVAGVEAGSVNFDGDPFVTSRDDARRVIAAAEDRGIALEAECFDLGHVAEVARLETDRASPIGLYNLVLGVPGGAPPTAAALQALAGGVPSGVRWTVTAIGRHQLRLLSLAMLLGADGIRVGFEDGVYVERGRLAASNAELVERIVTVARTLGRRVATVAEARRMLLPTGSARSQDTEIMS